MIPGKSEIFEINPHEKDTDLQQSMKAFPRQQMSFMAYISSFYVQRTASPE